jgi:hypothetical protein
MTQTVTVPANGVVLVGTNGEAETTSTATTGFSAVDIAVFIDGTRPPQLQGALYQRLIMANTTGITQMTGNWTLEAALPPLSPGQHTIEVAAASAGIGGSTATVGSNSTTALQSALTVTILHT